MSRNTRVRVSEQKALIGRRGQRGFSYLEILMALGNFAIGFAALAALNNVIGERNVTTQEVTAATLLAQNRLEALKLLGYSGINDNGTTVDGTEGPLDALGHSSGSGRYMVRWDIQNNVPAASLKRIAVTVTWTTDTGKQKVVNLDTVVSNVIP